MSTDSTSTQAPDATLAHGATLGSDATLGSALAKAIHIFRDLVGSTMNRRVSSTKKLTVLMSILPKMLDRNIEDHLDIIREITNQLLYEDILSCITYKHLVKIIKSGCLDYNHIQSNYINSNEYLINFICKAWLSSRNQEWKRFEYALRKNRSFKYPFCDVRIIGPRILSPLSWGDAIDEGETEGHDTPLHWFIRHNDVKGLTNALVQSYDPNVRNYYGYTAYTLAERFGNPEIIKCLDVFRNKSLATLACFDKLRCFRTDYVAFFQDLNEFLPETLDVL